VTRARFYNHNHDRLGLYTEIANAEFTLLRADPRKSVIRENWWQLPRFFPPEIRVPGPAGR